MTDIKNLYILQKTESHVMMKSQPTGHVHDTERINYINGYLKGLKKSVLEGTDVAGYFHCRLWTTLNGLRLYRTFWIDLCGL